MKRALALAMLLGLCVPAHAAESWMAGRWFGTGQPNDRSQMWLETSTADGRFHVLHRACRQGKAFDGTQDGTWSLKDDILTVRIDRIDGEAAQRTDVYHILRHDKARQTYRYEKTGFIYNSRKVDGVFQMPSCDLTS